LRALAIISDPTRYPSGGLTVSEYVLVALLQVDEIVTCVGPDTGAVIIRNEAPVPPAGTMTEVGTLAVEGVLLPSITIMPPVGAEPVSVTVPWETIPPNTLAGLIDNELTYGGATVIPAVTVPPEVAEIVTGVEFATGYVVIVNEALVLPAGTTIAAGTPAAKGVLLVSETDTPPLGADPVSVTVPWETIPPRTLDGLIDKAFTAGGVTVSVAVAVLP